MPAGSCGANDAMELDDRVLLACYLYEGRGIVPNTQHICRLLGESEVDVLNAIMRLGESGKMHSSTNRDDLPKDNLVE